MRALGQEEKDKRGCLYCLDYKKKRGVRGCKHGKCPYHELDEFETYEDYFNSHSDGLADIFSDDWLIN